MHLIRVIAPLFMLLFAAQNIFSQNPNPNLVPNPGFEVYNYCPDSDSEFPACASWFNPAPNNYSPTPDYYNACCLDYCEVGVPINTAGFGMYPHGGNGYCGLFTHLFALENSREYVVNQLIEPLTADSLYEVSFFVRRSGIATMAAPVSFHFWLDTPVQNATLTNNEWGFAPNGKQTAPITDTTWLEIHFFYLAMGAEEFISIGNNLADNETNLIETLQHPSPCQVNFPGEGYCLIDDVSVQLYPLPYAVIADTTICSGEMATLHAYGYQFEGWALASDPGTIISTDEILEVYPTEEITYRALFGENYQDITLHMVGYPEVDLGPDQALCAGDTLTLDVTQAGASYRWQDDSYASVYSITQPGEYILRLTSQDGCSVYDTLQANFSEWIDLDDDLRLCIGDTLVLGFNQIDGYEYIWSTGSVAEEIEVSTTGWIWLESDNGTCIYRDSLYATAYTYPVFTLGNDTTLCEGESYVLDYTGMAENFLWHVGFSYSPLPYRTIENDGAYKLTLRNYLCATTDTLNVFEFPLDIVELPDDTTLCNNEPLFLSVADHNYTQVWQDGSTLQDFTVSEEGLYWTTISISDCFSSDSIYVNYIDFSFLNFGNDTILCPGETMLLGNGNPEYLYIWQDGSNEESYLVNAPGEYSVIAAYDGCTATAEISIDYYPDQELSLGNDVIVCFESGITLTIEGEWESILWSDGSTGNSLTVDTTGEYWTTVSFSGCYSSDSIYVSYIDFTPPDFGNDTILCPGETLLLGNGNPEYLYIWQDGSNEESYLVDSPGEYSVISAYDGCTASSEIYIDYYPDQELNLGSDGIVCIESDRTLTIEGVWDSVFWSDGSTGHELIADTTGVYWVTANDICTTQSDTIYLSSGYCNCSLYLPYILNTGTLGVNEVNTTQFNCPVTDFSLKIYDPIGKLMAETNDIDWYWQPGPRTAFGVYVFVISYRFEHESEMRYLTQKVLVAERIRN
jgi:hypothetical protein